MFCKWTPNEDRLRSSQTVSPDDRFHRPFCKCKSAHLQTLRDGAFAVHLTVSLALFSACSKASDGFLRVVGFLLGWGLGASNRRKLSRTKLSRPTSLRGGATGRGATDVGIVGVRSGGHVSSVPGVEQRGHLPVWFPGSLGVFPLLRHFLY